MWKLQTSEAGGNVLCTKSLGFSVF